MALKECKLNFTIEFISENNNTYEFLIKFDTHQDKLLVYAPNYQTALSRANNYIKSQRSL